MDEEKKESEIVNNTTVDNDYNVFEINFENLPNLYIPQNDDDIVDIDDLIRPDKII